MLQNILTVGQYECYISSFGLYEATIILVDCLPLLEAEQAATSIARLLGSSHIELIAVKGPKGIRYGCKINNVPIKNLKEVVNDNRG